MQNQYLNKIFKSDFVSKLSCCFPIQSQLIVSNLCLVFMKISHIQHKKTFPSICHSSQALVNVVGLSSRQLRRDYAQTEYTPGPSIQVG